jgi:hypothetical protein
MEPMSERPGRGGVTEWVIWSLALGGAAYLAYRRYQELQAVVPNGRSGVASDFWIFLHGARQVAAGHSPYSSVRVSARSYGYVYTPLVALVLLPFCHASAQHIWHVWTALSLAALVLFGVLATSEWMQRLRSWRRPLLFGVTSLTVLQFLPTKLELSQGQVDGFVVVALAVAAIASGRGWAAVSGVLIGLGGLLKTWPAAVGLSAFRHNYAKRGSTLAALLISLAVGPALAAVLGGASELKDFLKTTVESGSQHFISHSVWTTPLLLFSHSGLAHPVLASTPLRVMATVILAAWVVGLLFLILLRSKSAALCYWQVVACVVLLVPVSHSWYTLYLLPLLWIWAARWLEDPRRRSGELVVTGLLALWWLVLFHINWSPNAVGSPTFSSLHISVIFFANLAALTVSSIGEQLVRTGATDPCAASADRQYLPAVSHAGLNANIER